MNAPDTLPASLPAERPTAVDLQQILRDAEVQPVIDQLESELIGLRSEEHTSELQSH